MPGSPRERVRQQLAAGAPGPEGSGLKLAFARLNQQISGLELELLGEDGLRYDDWTMSRPRAVDFDGRDAGYRYLRARGNSIEGGTSEILRNIIAERVLGLPGRAAYRQGRRVEGPAPMTSSPDLLYSDVEDELRAAVRDVLTDRCPSSAVLARCESGEPYDLGLWRTLAVELGLAGLLVPEERRRPGRVGARGRGRTGGAGRGGRPGAVPRQRGARQRPRCSARRAREPLARLGAGEAAAALAVPLTSAPGGRFPVGVRADAGGGLTGRVTSVGEAVAADLLVVAAVGPQGPGLYEVAAAAAGVRSRPR